jgi:hypothetical protein
MKYILIYVCVTTKRKIYTLSCFKRKIIMLTVPQIFGFSLGSNLILSVKNLGGLRSILSDTWTQLCSQPWCTAIQLKQHGTGIKTDT